MNKEFEAKNKSKKSKLGYDPDESGESDPEIRRIYKKYKKTKKSKLNNDQEKVIFYLNFGFWQYFF